MQDCHSKGKISEFVNEVKCTQSRQKQKQVENEDKMNSQKAKVKC